MPFTPLQQTSTTPATSSGFVPLSSAPVPTQPNDTSGASFPSTGNESILGGALKTIGNIPSSVINTVKSGVESIPTTVQNLYHIPSEFQHLVQESGGGFSGTVNAIANTEAQLLPSAYGALVPKATQQVLSGDFQGARASLQNDPVGQILPYLLIGKQVAEKAGLGSQFDSAISKVANPVTTATEAITNKATNIIKPTVTGATKFAVTQATGLSPDTISQVMSDPAAFTKEAQATLNRGSLADEVKNALDIKQTNLSETGTGYTDIRNLQKINEDVAQGTTKSITENGHKVVYNLVDAPNDKLSIPELRQKINLLSLEPNAPPEIMQETKTALNTRAPIETVPHDVKVTPTWLDRTIKDTTGIDIKNGQLTTSGSASIRDTKDIRALQGLYDTYKPLFIKGTLTSDEFLNFRSDLAKLAKFDREIGKSQPLENLSGIIRGKFNTAFRSQIPNLQNIDTQFSTQSEELNRLQKGILDTKGNLTDTGINRIANATGKGKDLLISKLEEISPGITGKIKTLKAIEDIQAAGGQKVGAYARAGGLVGGIATLNPYLIVGSILSIPEIAVPILRGIGMTASKIRSTLNLLGAPIKEGAKKVNNIPNNVNLPLAALAVSSESKK